MRLKFCLPFLWCLAAVALVQSETIIEVDENGDEYEVKRFHIESRQLNGGRSQCVETRRKRSTAAYYGGAVLDGNDENTNDNKNGIKFSMADAAPTLDTKAGNEDDYDDEDDLQMKKGDSENNAADQNKKKKDDQKENNVSGQNNNDKRDEDDYDYNYDYENEDGEGIDDDDKNPEQENTEIYPVIINTGGVPKPETTQQVAVEALNANGIVVYESDKPPKVNPDTHAVFQLLPVNHAIHAAANYQDQNNDGHLDFEEEISPITTSAIWSTGADNDLNPNYVDYETDDTDDEDGDEDSSNLLKKGKDKKKPNKANKRPMKRPSKKPNKGPAKRPNKSNKRPIKRPNKRPAKKPNKSNKRPMKRPMKKPNNKPNKRPTKRPNTSNKRPANRPNKKPNVRRPNRPNMQAGNSNNQSTNRRKNSNGGYNRNSNRNSNSQLINRDIKRRKNNYDFVKDQGTNVYTKVESYTQTNGDDGEKNVNCIIIRKDPDPTTPRPFWNVFGRNVEDAGRSGHFGKRKRINLRIVPEQ